MGNVIKLVMFAVVIGGLFVGSRWVKEKKAYLECRDELALIAEELNPTLVQGGAAKDAKMAVIKETATKYNFLVSESSVQMQSSEEDGGSVVYYRNTLSATLVSQYIPLMNRPLSFSKSVRITGHTKSNSPGGGSFSSDLSPQLPGMPSQSDMKRQTEQMLEAQQRAKQQQDAQVRQMMEAQRKAAEKLRNGN